MLRLLLFVLPTLVFLADSCSLAGDLPATRWEFYQAFCKLEEGDSQEKVLKILGQPDDVVKAVELPGFVSTFYPRSEYWNYGTAGHLTLATQGHISFDYRGRITNTVGRAEPIPTGLFAEQETGVFRLENKDRKRRIELIYSRFYDRQTHWDAQHQRFTAPDGKFLPAPQPVRKRTYAIVWQPENTGLDLVIRRQNKDEVEISIVENLGEGALKPSREYEVYLKNGPEDSLSLLKGEGHGTFSTYENDLQVLGFSKTYQITKQSEIQIKLTLGGKTCTSRIFEP